jgi:hypothetical protein
LYYANLNGADLTDADLSGTLLVGANLVGADLRGATLDNAGLPWANLHHANIAEEEIERLAARNALQEAMLPDGSRPFPVPSEVEAVLRKHPESQLAQRERELRGLARAFEQQAR